MTIPRSTDLFNSLPVNISTNTSVIRFDPNDNAPIYIGVAPRGTSTSTSDWTIYKLTYSGSYITLKQTGFGAWDDRTTISYG